MQRETFEKEKVPALMKELGLDNVMQVPRIVKVVVNMGIKEKDNPKILEGAAANLAAITGQRPIVTKARKSISDFHLTQGEPIGCKVTLRRDRAHEFLFKLINVTLPGIRDFRGLSASGFDGRGNYSLGLSEQLAFPEISYDAVASSQGMDITIVTTAKTDQHAYALLKAIGVPFKD